MKRKFYIYIYSKESWVHLSYPWARCSLVIQNMKNYSKGVRGGSTLITHLVLSNSHDHHLVVFNNVPQQLVSPNNARQTNGLTLLSVGLWGVGGRSNNKSLLIWTLLNTSLSTCLSKATRIGGISTTIMGKLWTYLMLGPHLCSKKCLWLNLVLGPLPISISPLAYCLRTWHKDPLHSFVM